MTTNFQYTPFSDPASQIRLLHIAPGPPDSPVHCTISAVPLKPDPPSYVAISYTWGPPTPTATITIDGKALVVRQSCYNVLQTMRLNGVGVDVPVWIDAVCINQSDTPEKNVQVDMMGSIYHGAAWVAACLECGDALSILRNYYGLLLASQRLKHNDSGMDGRLLLGDKQVDVFERWQEAVYSVMDNAYFTRMWIVQEIGLARDIRLYSYGDVHTLTWEDLETQAYDWRGKMMALDRFPWSRTTTDEADLERALKELADTRTEMGSRKDYPYQESNKSLTLTGLMGAHLRRRCENPRDKIYAVLPMLKHIGGFDAHQTVVPDYGKPLLDVLREYVDAIRFPAEPERRNSISTGYELWPGLKVFECLVDCFKVPEPEIASFLDARRLRARRPGQPFPPQNYLETHFVGLAMQIRCCCPRSKQYAALVQEHDDLKQLHPEPQFLAVWNGLPSAVFTLGLDSAPSSQTLEAFPIFGYYPCRNEVQLSRTCECKNRSCPGKRSKQEMCKWNPNPTYGVQKKKSDLGLDGGRHASRRPSCLGFPHGRGSRRVRRGFYHGRKKVFYPDVGTRIRTSRGRQEGDIINVSFAGVLGTVTWTSVTSTDCKGLVEKQHHSSKPVDHVREETPVSAAQFLQAYCGPHEMIAAEHS